MALCSTGQDVVDVGGGVVVVEPMLEVVVMQLQALDIRDLPQVAAGLGAGTVLVNI